MLSCLALAVVLAAAEPAASDREFNGHYVPFPVLQQSGMVTTSFAFREGVAILRIPDLPTGDLGNIDVSAVSANQWLEASFLVTEWLGLSAQLQIQINGGLSVGSLVANGILANGSGEAGAVFRLWRSDHSGTQVSFRATGGYDTGAEVNLIRLLEGVAEAPIQSIAGIVRGGLGQVLITPSNTALARGGIHLVQAFGPWFSLQGSFSTAVLWKSSLVGRLPEGDRVQLHGRSTRLNFAAAANLDFRPVHVPISLMAEYLVSAGRDWDPEDGIRRIGINTVGLGIYYSGRSHFELSLNGYVTLGAAPRAGFDADGERADSGPPSIFFAQLGLRYIW